MLPDVSAAQLCKPTSDLYLCSLPSLSFLEAEFSEINLASYVNSGCMVDMQANKGGTRVVR